MAVETAARGQPEHAYVMQLAVSKNSCYSCKLLIVVLSSELQGQAREAVVRKRLVDEEFRA